MTMKTRSVWMTVLAILIMACNSNSTKKSTDQQSAEKEIAVWDNSYGGTDKSYDTKLLKMRDEIAPRFQTLNFEDKESGLTMTYNLFVPENYNPETSYPLVLFMADGSTTGKGAVSPLMQGYGGIIWATEESQAEHPCFVLVPSYEGPENVVNDQWETSPEVDLTLRLLHSVMSEYSVDTNRLYTTGQSMGGMMSFYFNATHPDLFAASLFVGSQWDINVLEPLADMNFFYVVSAGDMKASGGMKEVGNMLTEKGVAYGTTTFSAQLPDADKESEINKLISQGFAINFVQFEAGTVTPENSQGHGGEHMYSFDYAYQLKGVRDWLFNQVKEN